MPKSNQLVENGVRMQPLWRDCQELDSLLPTPEVYGVTAIVVEFE